jgi:hypothetical protein
MRIALVTIVTLGALGLISCSRQDNAHRDAPAREAGRDAYKASREIKQQAKKAEHELRDAGKDFQQGWNEEKKKSPKKEPPRQ